MTDIGPVTYHMASPVHQPRVIFLFVSNIYRVYLLLLINVDRNFYTFFLLSIPILVFRGPKANGLMKWHFDLI